MACRRRPDVGMAQSMRDRPIPAGALAIHAATSRAAATEALLDGGQHFLDQEIFPGARGSGVDILVAANSGETVWEGNDNRRHALLTDQSIEALRHVLAEGRPIGLGQAAARYADQVDKQRQPATVVIGGDIDIDRARHGIPENIPPQDVAFDDQAADGAHRSEELAHQFSPRWPGSYRTRVSTEDFAATPNFEPGSVTITASHDGTGADRLLRRGTVRGMITFNCIIIVHNLRV